MAAMNEARRTRAAVAMTVLGIVLSGCDTSTELAKPCCYRGDVALTHLVDTRLTLENGSTVAFDEVFTGFSADPVPLARVLPFRVADIRLVTFASLRDILPKYDANETARGLGHPVARIDPSGRGGAIATSQADVSALVRFVERHLNEMAQPQRRIFYDLRRLGDELQMVPILLDD